MTQVLFKTFSPDIILTYRESTSSLGSSSIRPSKSPALYSLEMARVQEGLFDPCYPLDRQLVTASRAVGAQEIRWWISGPPPI